MKTYVYDIETYKNLFCAVFRHGDEHLIFEISKRKNQLEELLDFYTPENIQYTIGFNCVRFDAQVLELIRTNHKELLKKEPVQIAIQIYLYAQEIIEKSNAREFLPYPEWKITVPQIDLYLINNYNNKNRATSLKWVEYSLNYPKVQDLPYHHTDYVNAEDFDKVIDYCKNDVGATRLFAEKCRDIIKLRLDQDKEYEGLWLRNKSDPALAETLFLHFLSEDMNIEKKELKKLRTHRTSLPVKDLILPYINFKTPEFQRVLEFYNNAYSGGVSFSQPYKGIIYEYGEGGLHASWENKIFEEDDEYLIDDRDFSSYYPNLSIINNFKPEHLGESYSTLYKNIYESRKKFPKGSSQNISYKLMLNSNFGKMGDEYSFLLDIKPKLQICINGQLLLSMLTERLSFIPQLTIIQANTDGLSLKYRREDKPKVDEICKRFEKLTNLELEDVQYKKMIISNVNNYIAVTTDGKVKFKGMYEIDQEPHKNRSQRIVKIALFRYFVYGIPVKETIENHLTRTTPYENNIENQGIYDFCLGKKVKWNQTYVLLKGTTEEIIKEKVIRYYITTEKATMYKKYSDGRIEAVNKGYNAKLFQEYVEEDYNIDYNYYINEAFKITTPFDGGNEKIGYQTLLEL